MEKKQAFNPYLPGYEYIPDAEPRVFGDRVYIYGSHDKFNGISFCLLDYVCWSAPADDLSDWRYEGVIFSKKQDPGFNLGFINSMYAPDAVQGPDGRYYLYYFIGYRSNIGVAVCDTPAGKYEYLGKIKYADGTLLGKKGEPLQFDPGIFIDDDGKVFLYTGFGPVNYPKLFLGGHKATEKGAMCFELEPDMITVKSGLKYIGVPAKPSAKGTGYEGHEFFEASSMRKFDGKYYFVYSSFLGHELCYAVSDKPDGGFDFGGTLVSNGDIGIYEKARNYTGNTHGSLAKIKGQYYIFYHRQTNRHFFSRQACAEKIRFEDGKFYQAELTSCGLNGGALKGEGEYEARTACHLYSKEGAFVYGVFKKKKGIHPYFTQYGKDRENNSDQHIANFCGGATACFKYFDMDGADKIEVNIKGRATGVLKVFYENGGEAAAEIPVSSSKRYTAFNAPLKPAKKITPLYFSFFGKGCFDFMSFKLIKS